MIGLDPMKEEEFDAFLEHGIREYAIDRAQAGFWTEAEALDRSRKAHAELLPAGRLTPDNYFYTIRVTDSGEAVGILWMKVTMDSPRPSGFILDLEIHERFRRRGYARQAMLLLEELARSMGLQQLGLNVFAMNSGARALYEHLGYTVASLNMLKPLEARAG